MTEKEVEIFKEVMQKNGIPYRETPRTKEEMSNLICIYNKNTSTFTIKHKDYVLNKDEVFIPIKGLYKDYTNLNNNNNDDSLSI